MSDLTRRERILIQLDDEQTAEFIPSLIPPVDTDEYNTEYEQLNKMS